MKKIILTAFIALSGIIAQAQATSSVSQTVTLTLVNSISISLTSATGNNFTFNNVNDYQNGLTNSNASTFLIQSNRPWTGTVRTATASFAGPAASPVMPSTVLSVRPSGAGYPFSALSTTPVNFGSADRGTYVVPVDYNVNPGFNYNAGTYTISVLFTATQM